MFEIIGEDAGYVHTARSRNDQVITDLKLWMIKSTNEIIKLLNISSKLIIKISEKNIHTIMPGFTHLKNAQAVSFSHYMLAYVEMFSRDKIRFKNNLKNLKENPLGVAALTGTSFDIDRNYTTKKLGFTNPTRNSIDTVSDRDFVTDFLYSASLCSMHISRLSEELINWNSDAYNLIFLNDKIDLIQAESISDLINASSKASAQSALLSMQGVFSDLVNELIEEIINLRKSTVIFHMQRPSTARPHILNFQGPAKLLIRPNRQIVHI